MHTAKYNLHIPTDITNKHILDYGCGNGNRIDTNDILPEYYTGVEIDKLAYHYCVGEYPQYKFIYQNLYSPMYNKRGINTFPLLEDSYDVIFAYSVFSHTSYEHFLECVDEFKDHLNPNGMIFISMVTFDNHKLIDYFTRKKIQQHGSCDEIVFNEQYGYLFDNKYNNEPNSYNQLLTVYNSSFLEQHGEWVYSNNPQRLLKIT